MFVYLFIIFLAFLCFVVNGHRFIYRSDYLEDPQVLSSTTQDIVLLSIVLIMLTTLRSATTGLDTPNYYNAFTFNLASIGFSDLLTGGVRGEVGYKFLALIFHSLGLGFHWVTLFEALVYVVPVAYIVHKYSRNPYYSLFLFVAYDYYLFSMSALRQTIAMGFVLIAFEMVSRKKTAAFFLCIALGVLFHFTAVVALPIYFLSRLSPSKRYIIAAFVASIFFFILRNQMRLILFKSSRVAYGGVETGGTGMYLMMLSMVLLDVFCSKKDDWKMSETDTLIRYMMISVVVIYPVLQFHPAVFRLHFYYSIMMIVYLPNVLRSLKSLSLGKCACLGYTAISVYYMFHYTFCQLGAVPYYFFWE